MSSYLLLRNNKESGPYTLDEVKGMSLKTYDLIWIVGKSAAWRYPGEIPELKSFAPSVPEGEADLFRKRINGESQGPDPSNPKIADPLSNLQSRSKGQHALNNHSVYINLPAEKKSGNQFSDFSLEDSTLNTPNSQESENDFSEIYLQRASAAARNSGKILWISTIILLFGAGIMTGFFISDRGKFFSSDENRPQNNSLQQVVFKDKKENLNTVNGSSSQLLKSGETPAFVTDSVIKTNPGPKKLSGISTKKIVKIIPVNKDSLVAEETKLAANRLNDSLKQDAISKSEILYQEIKTNPDKYLNLTAGRYSTGLFGGISSFPVSVTNNSSVRIALVEVSIDYIQNNDKIFKTETLSFNDLEPAETLTIKAPKSSRGTKISTHLYIIRMHQQESGSAN
ncbi:MAG TPA: hypothetical protein VGI38_09565 [Puia sp.]|jgi:hypothetical protein